MMDSSAVWNNQDPTLSGPSHDDFQQFLDMGINNLGDGLQFDFQDFNPQQGDGTQLMHQNGGEGMDTRMDSGRGTPGQDTTMQEHIPAMTTASRHTSLHGTPIVHSHPSSESLVELDAQIQYLQQQRHQQQQRQMQEQQRNYYAQRRIPPTPNSIEMHGSSSQFYPQSDSQEQAMYERFRMRAREQDVSL
jgi:hypothetical protein